MRRLFNNCKKTLAIFLSAFMAFSGTGLNVPVAMAQESEVNNLEGFEIVKYLEGPATATDSGVGGTCGAEGNESDVTWSLSDDGVLTISGNGAMKDYTAYNQTANPAPWSTCNNQITSVIVSDGVTRIGDNAFNIGDSDSRLTSVTLADSVVSIGKQAFCNCSALTTINLSKVTTISKDAFISCKSLTSVDISSVTELGKQAFYSCSKLETVILGDALENIDDKTFGLCIKLSNINLGKIKKVGNYAFDQCEELVNVDISNATEILDYAFGGCNRLASIKINNGVNIGESAFNQISSTVLCPITNVEIADCAATDSDVEAWKTFFQNYGSKCPDELSVTKSAHNLEYSVSDSTPNKLELKCANYANCGTATYATVDADAVVAPATDRVYDGTTEYKASVTYDSEWNTLTSNRVLDIEYKRNGNRTTDLKAAGTVTACIYSEDNTVLASCSYDIRQAELGFSTNPTLYGTYGTAVEDMTLTGGTAVYGETVITGTWSITDANKSDKPQVGTTDEYEVTFTPDSSYNGNYAAKTVKVVPTVTAKSLSSSTVTVSEVTGTFTYDGNAQEPTVSVSGTPAVSVSDSADSITDDDFDVSYSNEIRAYTLSSTDEGFDAANAPTVIITGKGNYEGTVTRYFTIDKKAATGIETANNENVCYALGKTGTWDVSALMPSDAGTVTYQDGPENDADDILTASVSADGVLSYTVASTGTIGNTASATVVASSINYGDITFTYTVTLVDKDTVTVNMDNIVLSGKDYDGQAITYTGEATGRIEEKNVDYFGTFEYKWFDSTGTSELSSVPSNAGTYVLKAIVSTEGYKGEGTKSVTISPATPSYTVPTGLTAVYGDRLSSVALGTGFTWQDAGTTAVGNVGDNEFKVTFTPTDTDNYKTVTDITVSISVSAKDLSATNVSISEVTEAFTYDGNAKKPTVTVSDSGAVIATADYEISYLNNVNAYTLKATDQGFDKTKAPVVKITAKGNYTGTIYRYFTIDKKNFANPGKINHSYIYSAGSKNETVTVDLDALLPNDKGHATYTLQYCDASYVVDEVVSNDGKLTYKVDKNGNISDTTDLIVNITTDNYTDVVATVNILLVDKNVTVQKASLPVKITGNTVLTYGETIDKLTLNKQDAVFVIEGTDTIVSGTLSWENPKLVPTVGTIKADWVFTPDLPDEYKTCRGNVAMSVVKANPIVKTPTADAITYNPGVSLSMIPILGENGSWKLDGADTEVSGKWSWKEADKVPVVNNSGYALVFTPDDTNNYNRIEKTISVKVNKANPYIAVLPRSSAITYGDNLDKANLSGGTVIYSKDSSVTAYNSEVKGEFKWKDGSIKPSVLDSYKTKYTLVFTPFDKNNYQACETEITLKVDKKAAKTFETETREFVYTVGSDKDQIVDIASMLPDDCGKVAYRVSKSGVVSWANITNGRLSYRVIPGMKDSEGSVNVTVVSDNYQNHNYTIKVKLVDKETVSLREGCVVAVEDENIEFIYGDKLSKLSLVQADGKNVAFVADNSGEVVEGTVKWFNPDYTPSVSEKNAMWKFVPDDTSRYMECTGFADINVVKATPDVSEIKVLEIAYNPSVSLKSINSSVKGTHKVGDTDVTVAGNLIWKKPNEVPRADKQEYEAVFVPDNQDDYNVSDCIVKIKVKKATPKIIILPEASDITYTELLADSKISGGEVRYSDDSSVVGYDVLVDGEFAWSNKMFAPSVSDSGITKFDVIFTPKDTVNYDTVKDAITVNVGKIENAPNMPIDTMKVSFAVDKKVSNVSLEDYEGWEWSQGSKDVFLTSDENGVVAVAEYIDWDKGNYTNITKTVTIYMEQCNHKGGHATCIRRAVCNICKQEYGEINPDNHENVELKNMTAATCVTDGYTGDLCCTDCGGVLAQGENIRATGHDYMISLEIPATTIKEGLRTYTCTVCGDSYSEDIPKIPTDDNPNSTDIIAKGVFVAEKTENSILAGMVVETANMEEVEYSWWVSRDGGERWSLIQGWTKGYEWLSWDPRGYGEYMIMGKARLAGKTTVVEASVQTTFHPAIKGICQMPYTGDGGGYLIGIESVDNGPNKYQYEMLILDCSLLAEGKDAWIYTTGKCGAEGNCLWTIWQPQYGYYWTLFRIYDNTGVLVDEMCYGFANAY